MNNTQIPQGYICPVSQEIMLDPVIDPNDGNSFDRAKIEEWIRLNHSSPLTRQPLEKEQLIPNRALKDAIDKFRKTNADPYENMKQEDVAMTPIQTQTNHSGKQTKQATQTRQIKPPTLTIVPHQQLTNGAQLVKVNIKIDMNEDIQRVPNDIVIDLDHSGSMGSNATTGSETSSTSIGLTLMDIAKHAILLIIETLTPLDRMCLVAFSSKAQCLSDFIYMDASGKKKMKSILDSIKPGGMTNFADGVSLSLDKIRTRDNSNNPACILAFTDGQPNMEPPEGYIGAFQHYRDTYNGFGCSISTFGFGYNLNSGLLADYATIGGGDFNFIPDSSFSITTFMHKGCNLLNQFASDASLSIETANGTTLLIDQKNDMDKALMESSWGAQLSLGNLPQGRSRDIVLSLQLPESFQCGQPYINVSLNYRDSFNRDTHTIRCSGTQCESHPEVGLHVCRTQFVNTIMNAHYNMEHGHIQEAQMLIESLTQSVHIACNSMGEYKEHGLGLLQDLSGQVSEAFSRNDWFNRWGKHYLLSLVCAHKLQQCNNFKDKGIQYYTNPLFCRLRDEADQLCSKCPPPKPSGYVARDTKPITSQQMANMFHNCSNPCFEGSGMVQCVGQNQNKRVCDIEKGDIIINHLGEPDTVQCVLKTVSHNGFMLTHLKHSNVKITPTHPILVRDSLTVKSSWVHPYTISAPYHDSTCKAVYSFLMENRSSAMKINNCICATLAHGIQNDDIASHHYYGTEQIVNDLQLTRGFASGLVVMQSDCVVKNEHGMVIGLDIQKERFDAEQETVMTSIVSAL